MNLSIIIPTLNESANISSLLDYLVGLKNEDTQIIVVDGGSQDDTVSQVKKFPVQLIESSKPGRAIQMNLAAKKAIGETLYFLHSDTIPPKSFIQDIENAIGRSADFGCFRFRFDSGRFLLKINAYFTRFDKLWCRGGDQSLFIKKEVFEALNGFNESYVIMEEYDLIIQAKKRYKFEIIPNEIVVSARKYDHNSYLKVMTANFIAFNMFRFGYESQRIKKTYRSMLSD